MRMLDEGRVVVDLAVGVRILYQRPETLIVELKRLEIANNDFYLQRPGPSLHNVDGLGMTLRRNEEDAPASNVVMAHGHGLGRGGALVEQGGVRDLQTRQVDDHCLEIQQGLEPALGDFG